MLLVPKNHFVKTVIYIRVPCDIHNLFTWMDSSITQLVSCFLPPSDIRNVCKANHVNEHEMVSFALRERHGVESVPSGIRSFETELDKFVYMKEFHPETLEHIIVNNNMLDTETKRTLLNNSDKRVTQWFVDTFIVNSPQQTHSRILVDILRLIRRHDNFVLVDQYKFTTLQDHGIQVFSLYSNKVVAYANVKTNTVFYIERNVVAFLTIPFVFNTCLRLYKEKHSKTGLTLS